MTQRAVPMVSYQDVGSAADWLTEAFGFKETGERFTDNEGRVTHTQLELDGTEVMLGWPGPDYEDPARHAESCDRAWKWLDGPWVVDGVLVYVDDVDAHCERARSAGAQILRGRRTFPSAASTLQRTRGATAGCSCSAPASWAAQRFPLRYTGA